MRHYKPMIVLCSALLACSGGEDAAKDGGVAADGNMSTNSDGGAVVADAGPLPDATPNPQMGFFVTSTGSGAKGGDLGGLAGADAKCQQLAALGGAGLRTWHAYLSTGPTGPGPIVNARDRIGTGPWKNPQGTTIAENIAALHANGILASVVLTELGDTVPSSEHDILTGSDTDGRLLDESVTCNNWTDGTTNTQGQVGHADIEPDDEGQSWNSQHSGSCDEESLNGNAGTGRLYCFAID